MDNAMRSAGLGRAPWHGFFHTIISIIILGLSAYLFHKFKKGSDNYVKELSNVYLYDLIVSALSIAGGVLIILPFIGRPLVLAIALLIPALYIAGFGWTEFEHHRLAENLVFHKTATALVVFLAIAAFLGIFAFFAEISAIRGRTRASKSSNNA